MGRPKVFPALFQDLVGKYKSKAAADKEYKAYMLLAKEQGLDKDARLSDIQDKPQEQTDKRVSEPPTKKQRVTAKHSPAAAGVSGGEKELYERLVEAERLRAEAEKQRGDDLSKIAMMLAAGKGEEVVPQSPPAAAADKSTSNTTTSKSPSNDTTSKQERLQEH